MDNINMSSIVEYVCNDVDDGDVDDDVDDYDDLTPIQHMMFDEFINSTNRQRKMHGQRWTSVFEECKHKEREIIERFDTRCFSILFMTSTKTMEP